MTTASPRGAAEGGRVEKAAASPAKRSRRSRLIRCAHAVAILILICGLGVVGSLVFVAASIDSYAEGALAREAGPDPPRASVAIVLGAAVLGDHPSPAFRERIKHAVELHRSGRVKRILFTGGRARGDTISEAVAGKNQAMGSGVPARDILVETSSTTTFENLMFARRALAGEARPDVLIVSDPLHLKRAIGMASAVGFDAQPSPTGTSVYRTWAQKRPFLYRETELYLYYLLSPGS